MRPFYRKDLFRDEIIKIMPKELSVKVEHNNKKLSILKMEKGQSYTLNSEEYEVALVILSGSANVRAGEFNVQNKGDRKDVFSGQPTMIYIPRKTEYIVTAAGYGILEVALCMVKADKVEAPFIIESSEIIRQTKGVFNWQREISEIITPQTAQGKCGMIVGETYGCPGTWATYPYKEDDKETVYFFKFSTNPGKRMQVMRSEENSNQYRVSGDTAVVVEEPYQPVASVDECDVYTLWFKATN